MTAHPQPAYPEPTLWRQHLNWREQIGFGPLGSFHVLAKCKSPETADFIIHVCKSHARATAEMQAYVDTYDAGTLDPHEFVKRFRATLASAKESRT